MTLLSSIRKNLASHTPELIPKGESSQSAAVSVIVCQTQNEVDVLFIERATRADDPWSGQMAFPGGKHEPGDVHGLATAIRETHEEVGLNLPAQSCIGRLDDLASPVNNPDFALIVEAYVFELPRVPVLAANTEVDSILWIPISRLANREYLISNYQPLNYPGSYPAIRVAKDDERVIWGLTYRFLLKLFVAIGIRESV